MRILSRAFWVNPLSWQDDEERGLLVPILHELTQGASFYDATCERIPGSVHWLICFWYKWSGFDDGWHYYCTTSADPQPPPPPGPGPPPPGYPDDYEDFSALLFPNGGTLSCWGTFPADGPEFDPSFGPWGGWGMVFESTTIGDITMIVYVLSWVPGAFTWRCEWEVFGGGSGVLDVVQAAGFSPAFPFGLGGIPDCPAANLTLSTLV